MADTIYDATAGQQSRELGIDPTTGKKGSNQFLVGNQHDDSFANILVDQSNRVQAGQLPKTASASVRRPTAANPAGFPEESINQ